MKFKIKIVFILLILAAVFSCKKDNFNFDSSAKLEFSADTIMFDTIFTTIGSTTQQFKIYNRNKEYLRISSIYLANSTNTKFRLNINGIRATRLTDVEIPPKDSLFVFVEVTLDVNNQSNPMVIVDSVVCVTNGNIQDVKLVAFGQDVHRITGEIIQSQTWTNDKPYLVYNSMLVDSLHTLTINEGVTVYFHRGSTMYVKGNLIVNGTKDNPVVFRNDRLEHIYDDVPSQWNGLLLFSGSNNNFINYAEIRNAVIGLQVGTIEDDGGAKLEIRNSKIENNSYAGVFAIASDIKAYNCIFANAGFYTTAIIAGGSYEYYHCTFANFWTSTRTEPQLILSNNVTIGEYTYVGNLTKAYFGNCIIWGNNSNEIGFSNEQDFAFNYQFDHSVLKIDPATNTSDQAFYVNIIKNQDPRFKSTYDKYDFQLDTLSPVKDHGSVSIVNLFPSILSSDFNQNSRTDDAGPDPGAFERKEN